MSKRIFLIALALVTVALISALFLLNPQPASVNFGSGRTFAGPMALILIVSFIGGTLFAFALAFISQFKLALEAWRERRLRAAERSHLKELVTIRELVALEKYQEAIPRLSLVLKEDPDNAACRALLASCQDAMGDSSSALRTLEEGRGRVITSAELYLQAALIYEKQGNLTAALDNLSLLLKSHPTSKKVLREGVRIAEKLGETERAIQFQERLLKLLANTDYLEAQEKLAWLELQLIQKKPRPVQSEEISRLLKKHRNFAPAFKLQAELDELRGESELANRSLVRAYEISQEPAYLAAVASLWLKKEDPDKAVKNVKIAMKDRSTVEGRAYLVCLLSSLGMTDEAHRELERVETTGKKSPLIELAQLLTTERSTSGHPGGHSAELTSRLRSSLLQSVSPGIKASLDHLGESRVHGKAVVLKQKEQPAPQLSTP